MPTKTSPIEDRPMSAVHQAIVNVTDALSKAGISKSRKNQQQGYNFRGIDDIYNALAPELAKNRLCILPEVLERSCEERQSTKGGALFYVTVRVRFDFISAEDGSMAEVVTFGEAMDSGDKATNKAMSAAYKYAAMMTFCIPTIGEDSETETHEVRSRPQAATEPVDGQLTERASQAAQKGSFALRSFWGGLGTDQKTMLKPLLDSHLKPIAEAADKAREQNPEDGPPVRSPAGPRQQMANTSPDVASPPGSANL